VVVFLCIKSKTKAGIELIRKPRETVAGIWNGIKSLNGDKVKQMISSVSGAAEYSAGGDRAKHQAGKHGVQATMMVIGSVKFLTNGKEVLDGAGKGMTDLQKFIPDGTTGHPSANALKNAADNGKVVKKIDDDKVLTQNVEGNQSYTVGVEKNGNDVKVYKVKDDELVDHRTGTSYSADDIAESAKDIDKPKTVTTVNGKQQIETDAGGTGSWNKELNNPKPDAEYRVKNNGATPHKYTTDGEGRVTNVEADLNLSTRSRNGYQQSVKCKGAKDGNPTDHGGHLIGSRFDGAGEQINLVPMTSNLNLSQWKTMENNWELQLNAVPPKNIKVQIEVKYEDPTKPSRPTRFIVIETIDGTIQQPRLFNN
jgi:DNA/RNA non-specific endonuclease